MTVLSAATVPFNFSQMSAWTTGLSQYASAYKHTRPLLVSFALYKVAFASETARALMTTGLSQPLNQKHKSLTLNPKRCTPSDRPMMLEHREIPRSGPCWIHVLQVIVFGSGLFIPRISGPAKRGVCPLSLSRSLALFSSRHRPLQRFRRL